MSTISPPTPYSPEPGFVDDDGDYQYFWSIGGVDVPIPHSIAEILDVPFVVRLELFMVGVCTGLIIGAIALLIALYSSVG